MDLRDHTIKTVRLNKAMRKGKGLLYVTIPLDNPDKIQKGDKVLILPLTFEGDIYLTNKEE